ncbi:ribonuclease Z 1 [Naviculisporaceae sp. PSN 640]
MSNWVRAKILSATLRLSTATANRTTTATALSFSRTRFLTTSSSCCAFRAERGETWNFYHRKAPKTLSRAKELLSEAGVTQETVKNPPRPPHTALIQGTARKYFTSYRLPDLPDGLFPGFTPYRGGPPGNHFWGLIPESPEKDTNSPKPIGARMHTFVQVIQTPTADTPGATLLLHFDHKRYLFGHISDGSQRVGVERGMHLHKVGDIFLTGPVTARNSGGLFGMVLTIADIHNASRAELIAQNRARTEAGKQPIFIEQKPPLNIHGGKNLAHMLASGRFFVLRDHFPIEPDEILTDPRSQDPTLSAPDFADPLIRVWNVPLFRSGTPGCDAENPRKRRRSDTPVAEGLTDNGAGTGPESDQELRKKVIKAMFDSEWKLDKLQECMLSLVKLPATVFYRGADHKLHVYEGPLPGQPGFQDRVVFVRRPWPASTIQALPPTSPAQDSMCYIVKEQPRRGKFLPQAASALGVPKTMNKVLAAGESVTLEDGTVITPEQVLEPAPRPVGFAILDVRDPALIDSLVTRPEWSNKEIMEGVTAIYWILDESVKSDPRLVQFMSSLDNVKHIILGQDISQNELAFRHAAQSTTYLNKIDPERFPLPLYSTETPQLPRAIPENASLGRPNEKFKIAPTIEFLPTDLPEAFDPRSLQDKMKTEGAPYFFRPAERAAARAAKKIADPRFTARVEASEKDIPQRDLEIITLGTGSCMPSMSRNVSSTLLRLPGYGTCLLDCGEGTLGQMRRTFGPEETDNILRQLRFIYISHLHADHHLGTNAVLERLGQVQDPEAPPVYIICPRKYASYIRECQSLEYLGRIELLTRTVTPYPITSQRVIWEHSPDWISKNIGLRCLSAVFMDHCLDAMGVAFTWPSGLKIAYSGDCRPSKAFANIGRDAHLLIHECTFDDERQGDAMAKKHSTFSEALDVAKQMGARRLLLTHFSQRYPRIQNPDPEDEVDAGRKSPSRGNESGSESLSDSEGEEHGKAKGPVVLFAFDQMRVKLGEFRYAAKYLPALRLFLTNEEKEVAAEEQNKCAGGESANNGGEGNGKKDKKGKKGKKQNKGKGRNGGAQREPSPPEVVDDTFIMSWQRESGQDLPY